MRSYHLQIAAPDGAMFDGEVLRLVLRGANGELAVMAGHIPFMTSVQPCRIKILTDAEEEKIGYADGGLLTVDSDKTTLLSGNFRWEADAQKG